MSTTEKKLSESLVQDSGERKKSFMKEKIQIGDIVEGTHGKMKRVADFLPKPEELVLRPKPVRVTLTLDADTVDYFKAEAERLAVPYQRMIRNLLNDYKSKMGGNDHNLST